MSGPKYSDIEVASWVRKEQGRERQRRLEEERHKQKERQEHRQALEKQRKEQEQQEREEQHRIAEEQRKRQQAQQKQRDLAEMHRQMMAVPIEEHSTDEETSRMYQERDKLNDKVQALLKLTVDDSIKLVLSESERLQPELEYFTRKLLPEFMRLLETRATSERERQQLRQLQEGVDSLRRSEQMAYSLTLEQPIAPVREAESAATIFGQLEQLVMPYIRELPGAGQDELQLMLDAAAFIVNSNTLTNTDKAEQCRIRLKSFLTVQPKYEQEVLHWRQRYEEQHSIYLSLCSLLQIEADEQRSGTVKRPCEHIDALIQLNERLGQQWEAEQEAEYIAASIHEVMEELGNKIVATDYMEAGQKNFIHHMYDLGDGNVINAFTSDKGSVLFEVSGAAEGKRVPTAQERLRIYEGMELFCTQYDEIKKRLDQRGIYLKKESLKAPDEKYARIIDVSNKQKVDGNFDKHGKSGKSGKSNAKASLRKNT